MKPINRRSFFVRLAGFFALFFVSPMKAVAPLPVFSLPAGKWYWECTPAGSTVGFPAFEKAMLRSISASIGLPYALVAMNFSKASYSFARDAILLENQLRLEIAGPEKRRPWNEKA